jgi:hypothetical protein
MLPETMNSSDDLLERQRRGREDFSAFFISPPARLLRLTEQFIARNTAFPHGLTYPSPTDKGREPCQRQPKQTAQGNPWAAQVRRLPSASGIVPSSAYGVRARRGLARPRDTHHCGVVRRVRTSSESV